MLELYRAELFSPAGGTLDSEKNMIEGGLVWPLCRFFSIIYNKILFLTPVHNEVYRLIHVNLCLNCREVEGMPHTANSSIHLCPGVRCQLVM